MLARARGIPNILAALTSCRRCGGAGLERPDHTLLSTRPTRLCLNQNPAVSSAMSLATRSSAPIGSSQVSAAWVATRTVGAMRQVSRTSTLRLLAERSSSLAAVPLALRFESISGIGMLPMSAHQVQLSIGRRDSLG